MPGREVTVGFFLIFPLYRGRNWGSEGLPGLPRPHCQAYHPHPPKRAPYNESPRPGHPPLLLASGKGDMSVDRAG